MFIDGGWFSSRLKVQVRRYVQWVGGIGLNISPAYPYDDAVGPIKVKENM